MRVLTIIFLLLMPFVSYYYDWSFLFGLFIVISPSFIPLLLITND